jgi:hypothetical protein
LSLVNLGSRSRDLRFPDEYLVGCNMAFESSFLRHSGGFDTDLGRQGKRLTGNEEIAMLARLHALGGQIRYEPGAAVRHHIQPEREQFSWFLRRLYYQGVSDGQIKRRPSRAGASRKIQSRILGHIRDSRILTRPVYAAFTVTMAGAYASGRLASWLGR